MTPYPLSANVTTGPVYIYNIGPLKIRPGTIVARVALLMSDGSWFAGCFNSNGPLLLVQPPGDDEMASVVLSRDLTSADDGNHVWTLSFTQNGVSVSATVNVSITAPTAAVPTAVTVSPDTVSLPDNATAGTMVTTPTITMSDGSVFAGTMSAVDEGGNSAPVNFMA